MTPTASSQGYERQLGEPLSLPVFWGLQILEPDGVLFSTVPEGVRAELEAGRTGVDIAEELYGRFEEAGLRNIYLVPPIRRGGARNYGRCAGSFFGGRLTSFPSYRSLRTAVLYR